jgi:hypothetical protein
LRRNALTFTPIIGEHEETCARDECISAAVFRVEVEGYQSDGPDVVYMCPFHTLTMAAHVIDTSENDYRKGLYDEYPAD